MDEKVSQWLLDILKELSERNFYGKLEIAFQGGQVVYLKQEETLKPPK